MLEQEVMRRIYIHLGTLGWNRVQASSLVGENNNVIPPPPNQLKKEYISILWLYEPVTHREVIISNQSC